MMLCIIRKLTVYTNSVLKIFIFIFILFLSYLQVLLKLQSEI